MIALGHNDQIATVMCFLDERGPKFLFRPIRGLAACVVI